MSTYTRAEWAVAFLVKLGNQHPHPWMVKYVAAWTQLETGNPEHYARHNLLNTTENAFGCDLLPEWNEVHVRQYPTFEDGVAANVAALIGGPIFYYPTLAQCLIQNNGLPLGARGEPDERIVRELNTWSGNANYAQAIADLANNETELRLHEEFPGRHAGEAS